MRNSTSPLRIVSRSVNVERHAGSYGLQSEQQGYTAMPKGFLDITAIPPFTGPQGVHRDAQVAFQIFAGREFRHLGAIEPERRSDGEIYTFMPQQNYRNAAAAALHAYGAGPFCRFRIGRDCHHASLYVLTVNDVAVYAGECVAISKRWGPNGYGGISPRNCFQGGQSTNCGVNATILAEALCGRRIDLWFSVYEGTREERLEAETKLIRSLNPAWNRAKRV